MPAKGTAVQPGSEERCLAKHLGSRSELVACAWLLSQGYSEVLRNVSSCGLVDIAAVKDGRVYLFDGEERPAVQLSPAAESPGCARTDRARRHL